MLRSSVLFLMEAAKVYLSIAAINTIVSQNPSLLIPESGQDAGVIIFTVFLSVIFAYAYNKDLVEEIQTQYRKGHHH